MEIKMYSISELSGILNLHPKTIIRFIHEGKIRARKIGRSWMVSENELKLYCHGEQENVEPTKLKPEYETINERISVSAVVEIREQNSEEASRLSNTFLAMLNSEKGESSNIRFDSFYFPEAQKSKYVFYGSPEFIGRIMDMFNVISKPKIET
jgi:excisionase family DNA binding protein